MVSCGFFKNMGHSEPDYYQNSGSSYSARSDHDAGVKHWEETLSRKDRELNGMKTETDEEIHHDAEMLQHEQDEGISPAGMLEREIDGRNDK
jgi:hypothetical protein